MAILLGTQSNGDTLPVQVNEFGQLVAKGIDGSQGEPGAQGQPGETGPPGQPGPAGEGVPQPYGAEGTYLRIQSGVPTWLEGPPEPPDPAVVLTDSISPSVASTRVFINDTGGRDYPTSGYDDWLRAQSYFESPVFEKKGLGVDGSVTNDWYEFNLVGAQGLVFEVAIAFKKPVSSSGGTVNITLQSNNPQLAGVVDSLQEREDDGRVEGLLKFTYLVNAAEINNVRLSFEAKTSFGGDGEEYALVQSYQLMEPTTYAMRRMEELRTAIREVAAANS